MNIKSKLKLSLAVALLATSQVSLASNLTGNDNTIGGVAPLDLAYVLGTAAGCTTYIYEDKKVINEVNKDTNFILDFLKENATVRQTRYVHSMASKRMLVFKTLDKQDTLELCDSILR